MSERIVPGPICDNTGIREAVCINTKKIYDSCREGDTTLYRTQRPTMRQARLFTLERQDGIMKAYAVMGEGDGCGANA